MKTPLLAALLLPLTALAHPWAGPPDPVAPAPVVELRAGPPTAVPPSRRFERDDDVRDLRSIDGTVAQLDRAAATRDARLLRRVDGRARGLLADELRESEREAERARVRASWGDAQALRRAEWKLSRVARLDQDYRALGWRIDPWSVARRRTILIDLDRLNRQELAFR